MKKKKLPQLRSGTKQGCPPLTTPFQHLLEVPINAIRQGNKRYTDWEGRNKTMFVDDMFIYVENLNQ